MQNKVIFEMKLLRRNISKRHEVAQENLRVASRSHSILLTNYVKNEVVGAP